MATYDIGDVVYLTWSTVNSSGVAVNPGTVLLSVTMPDNTSASVTTATASVGAYTGTYTPTKVGRYIFSWTATGTWPQATADIFEVRDINDSGIVSLDEVKGHLNIPATNTDSDEELRRFMDVSSELAEEYCGIVLGQRNITETFNGGDSCIRVNRPYVLSVSSLVENGVTLTSGTDFYLDRTGQRIYRLGSSMLFYTSAAGYWRSGVQNIVVTYRAGYTNPPPMAKQGVLELIKHFWQTQRGSMNVMHSEAESYQPATGYTMPRRVEQLFDLVALPGLS